MRGDGCVNPLASKWPSSSENSTSSTSNVPFGGMAPEALDSPRENTAALAPLTSAAHFMGPDPELRITKALVYLDRV